MGLIGDKAQLGGGTADWPGYFALLAQTVAVGGVRVFGLIMVWLFGREFSDRTAKDLPEDTGDGERPTATARHVWHGHRLVERSWRRVSNGWRVGEHPAQVSVGKPAQLPA
jgi:hypothetical protein